MKETKSREIEVITRQCREMLAELKS